MTTYLTQRNFENRMSHHPMGHEKREKQTVLDEGGVTLGQNKIWKQFEKIGTEMVITKNGR